ncbi:MAG: biotin/lipoyl-binding protein [Firmicutes bacterium]|nr:biotin/lipoyl-binding protein [Bacillota bacterium]
METNVKKREWVKTVAIIFLAVMLVLTFFSNTIMNHSLPEVATANVTSGTINAKIRGQGTVSANETYDVTIKQTRKVASIKVKAGQEVAAGDVLFTLEAEESDELKQAQADLESMELNYEKSLIAASTEAARENREVQKLQETYNDLLAQYHQYSTMDAKKVELEKTKAEASFKELQKDLEKAQKELSSLQTDKEYTQAQADVTSLEAEIESLTTTIDDATDQLNELLSGGTIGSVEEVQQKIRDTQEKQSQNLKKYADALAMHEANYQEFSKVAGDREELMEAYKDKKELLVGKLIELGYGKSGGENAGLDESAVRQLADAMLDAYAALKPYYDEEAVLEKKLTELDAELKAAQEGQTTQQTITKLNKTIQEATAKKTEADGKLGLAERTVKNFEADIKKAETGVEKIQDQVDAQQDVVDKLTNANTLASQVKSAKEALEDKIFEQSLSDGSSLDLEAAKKAIDEKKADIEKLTQNADETEVKAKVAGTVSNIAITAGSNANAETPLITLNLTDRGYTVKISVTADQAKKVRVGDNAELVNYWYGGDIQATLENITNDPQNPGKGRLLVFRLTGDVEPDTNLTLSIGQKSANYDCIVPNSAVRTDSNGTFVLAITVKSSPLGNRYTATRVDVQELAKDDTNTAVTGLSSGDFVITTSTKPIEAGTQVRLVDNG